MAKNDGEDRHINQISFADFNIDGRQERIYGYVIQDLAYDVILCKPWMERNDVTYLSKKRVIRFGPKKNGLIVREKGWYQDGAPESVKKIIRHAATATSVIGAVFIALTKQAKKTKGSQIFAVTMKDINKALEQKPVQSLDGIERELPPEIRH